MRGPLASLGAVALVIATCCAPAPSRSAAADAGWLARAAATRTSPAAGEPGLIERWNGVDGKPVVVAVAAPRPRGGAPVETLRPDTRDAGAAFAAALGRLKAAGGGTLRLQPGDYAIDNQSGEPGLLIDGMSDVVIEAPGARLVFAQWGDGLVIRNSARVAIRGLSLGYARPAVIAAKIGGDVRGPVLMPADGAAPPDGASVYQLSRVDPRGPGFVAEQGRMLLGREGRRLQRGSDGALSLAGTPIKGFASGADVELKLSYYRGAALRVRDVTDAATTHDITLDGIEIRNSAGAGIAVDLMARGLAIVSATVGRTGPSGISSIAYDGIHVGSAAGDILLKNNQITGTADDAVNLASPIYEIAGLADGGTTATIPGNNAGIGPGAQLALFDAGLAPVGDAKVAARRPRAADGSMAVTLAGPVGRGGSVRYARNLSLLASRYAVVGNRIGRCGCHGVLVQGPNGLVSGNEFSNIRHNAIRVVTSAMWKEGAGAHNLVIERNRIASSGGDDRRGVVWGAITALAEGAGSGPAGQAPILRAPIHTGLVIRNNQIDGVAQGCVSIMSAADVKIAANRCSNYNLAPNAQRMLIERTGMNDAVRRLPAKAGYLAGGSGIWVDPLSTSGVAVSSAQ